LPAKAAVSGQYQGKALDGRSAMEGSHRMQCRITLPFNSGDVKSRSRPTRPIRSSATNNPRQFDFRSGIADSSNHHLARASTRWAHCLPIPAPACHCGARVIDRSKHPDGQGSRAGREACGAGHLLLLDRSDTEYVFGHQESVNKEALNILPAPKKGRGFLRSLVWFQPEHFRRVPVSSIGLTAPHLRRLHLGPARPEVLRQKNDTPKPAPYIPVLKNGALRRIWQMLTPALCCFQPGSVCYHAERRAESFAIGDRSNG
jgi:hypothetical protein